MQISNIDGKENTNLLQSAFKGGVASFENDFLSIMTASDDMSFGGDSQIVKAPPKERSDDGYSSRNERDDNKISSKSDSKADSKVDSKVDDRAEKAPASKKDKDAPQEVQSKETAAKDEVDTVVADTDVKDSSVSDSPVCDEAKESIVVKQEVSLLEKQESNALVAKNSVDGEGENIVNSHKQSKQEEIDDLVVFVPQLSQSFVVKEQVKIPEIASDIELIDASVDNTASVLGKGNLVDEVGNGEKFADISLSGEEKFVLPMGDGDNLDAVENVDLDVAFKKVISSSSDEQVIKSQISSKTDSLVFKESGSAEHTFESLSMSDDSVLEQAEFLSKNIIRDSNRFTKVSVEISAPETIQSNISQETLSVLNKSMEVKPNNTKAQSATIESKMLESSQPDKVLTGSSSFSEIVKSVKEKILGGRDSQSISTSNSSQSDAMEAGLGVSMKEQTVTSDSADSDILLMNRTYGAGKTGGTKSIAKAQTQSQQTTPRQVVDQIKVQIKQSNLSEKITVKLNPKELGQVELKVEVSKSGSVNVEITANKKETLELIRHDVKYLEKALQETVGKSESSPNFSFNLKGEQNPNQQQSQGHHRGNNSDNSFANHDSNPEPIEDKPIEYNRSGISIKV